MITAIVATIRLLRAIGRAAADPTTRSLLVLTGLVIALGVLFYVTQERWTVVDAIYFSVMTLTTVGYGDLTPTTDLSKLFTVVFSLVGIGLVASTVAALAVATVEDERLRRQRRGWPGA